VSDLNYGELKRAVNEAMRTCFGSLESGDAPKARQAAASAVELCEHSLNGGGSLLTGKEKSKTLIRGILAAACRDIADCGDLLQQPNLQGGEVEKLWNRIVDCLERLEYVQLRLDGAEVGQLIDRAHFLREQFDARFGTGLYANPEIVVRRELCSICNDDFRKCNHVAGRVYDGVLCRRLAEDAAVKSVTFVKQPVCLRCRVWPGTWDEKTKQYSFVEVLNSFRMDDLSDPLRR
jgi:hypothetical protein